MNRQATHCRDYSRSELLRHGMAQAGSGLPSVEPGMPTPAGSGLSRRSFLARSAGLALTVYGAKALAPAGYEEGVAAAMAANPGRVFVSIYLSGGVDGLSVLAPVRDARYRALRPNLAIPVSSDPTDVFSEDPRLQWHPAAARIRTLHSEGKVSVIPAIGYIGEGQSHFASRHFYEVGETNERNLYGWLGRHLDRNGTADNPLQGLTLGYTLEPSLAPARVPVSALGDPTAYDFWAENIAVPGMIDEGLRTLARIGAPNASDDADVAAARTALRQMSALKDRLSPLRGLRAPYQSKVTYPDTPQAPGGNLPTRLATVAEMLARGLPLQCVALQSDLGYDTHNNHRNVLNYGLKAELDAVYAFQRDLEARGLADRVVTHVWSEFGRRVPENGPDGTDHGSAGISFVIGNKVKGRMIGEFPGVTKLDYQDNLIPTADYRALYCSLLEQWMGVDAAPIIPGAAGFARPQVIR